MDVQETLLLETADQSSMSSKLPKTFAAVAQQPSQSSAKPSRLDLVLTDASFGPGKPPLAKDVKEVIDELQTQLPRQLFRQLTCVQWLSPRKVRLYCSSPKASYDIAALHLSFRSQPVKVVELDRFRWVSIMRVPFGTPLDKVRQVLGKYGVVKELFGSKYLGVFTGVLRAYMEITIPIPSSLMIGGVSALISYRGQVPTCFGCGAPRHAGKCGGSGVVAGGVGVCLPPLVEGRAEDEGMVVEKAVEKEEAVVDVGIKDMVKEKEVVKVTELKRQVKAAKRGTRKRKSDLIEGAEWFDYKVFTGEVLSDGKMFKVYNIHCFRVRRVKNGHLEEVPDVTLVVNLDVKMTKAVFARGLRMRERESGNVKGFYMDSQESIDKLVLIYPGIMDEEVVDSGKMCSGKYIPNVGVALSSPVPSGSESGSTSGAANLPSPGSKAVISSDLPSGCAPLPGVNSQ